MHPSVPPLPISAPPTCTDSTPSGPSLLPHEPRPSLLDSISAYSGRSFDPDVRRQRGMFNSDTSTHTDPLPMAATISEGPRDGSFDIRQQSTYLSDTSNSGVPLPTTTAGSGESQGVSSTKRRRSSNSSSSSHNGDDGEDGVRCKRQCGSGVSGGEEDVVGDSVDTGAKDKSATQGRSVNTDCDILDTLQVDSESSTVEVGGVEDIQVEFQSTTVDQPLTPAMSWSHGLTGTL